MTDVIAPPGVQEHEELHLPPSTPGHGEGHEPAPGGHGDHGPTGILKWLTSTDHKVIGLSYMITAIVIFYLSGVMALIMRLQLTSPHSSLLSFGLVIDTFWSGFWGALVLAIISFLIGLLFRPLLARSDSRR